MQSLGRRAHRSAWLNDVFVGHIRFVHQIPDRRGAVLEHDPLLAGVTDDGQRIRMGHDGRPVALNSPVKRDPATGEVQIKAKDQADLDRLLEREANKAKAGGQDDRPRKTASSLGAARRQRLGGGLPGPVGTDSREGVSRSLLAETQPASCRTSASADALRERLRDLDRGAADVELRSANATEPFAPAPASAVVVKTLQDRVFAQVSLLGVFAVQFDLGEDLRGIDLAWVSDPI